MIATKRYINHLRYKCRMKIDKELERYILLEYEEEPFPYEWSEQDLYEQISKIVNAYNNGTLDIPHTLSKYKRLRMRYDELQNEFFELAMLYCEVCEKLPERFDYLSVFMGVDTVFSDKEVQNEFL